MSEDQNTLRRDMIEGLLNESRETEAESSTEAQERADRTRDEAGRFAKKVEEQASEAPVESAVEAAPVVVEQAPNPAIQRPSTWKKDYWETWDKIQSGQPTTAEENTKLLAYINQRENEFKTGVSTYKAEADRSRELQQAIEPFVPTLNQFGVKPIEWITNLGRAHQALALGTPEQKQAIFQQLARDYGVSFDSQGQPTQADPTVLALQQQVRQLTAGWQQMQQTQEQAQEAQLLEQIKSMQEGGQHPHFEAVRSHMAQLLERGLAPDLQAAYEQAVWLNPETRALEAQKQFAPQASAQEQAQAAQRAQAKAVSVKSATPRVQASSASEKKDRRALIAEQLSGAASRV